MKNNFPTIHKSVSYKIILALLVLVSSCYNDKNITYDGSKITSLSWDSVCVHYERNEWSEEGNNINNEVDKIVNLKDTIEVSNLIGASYMPTDCTMGIEANDASIECVKRVVKLYPTIWSTNDMRCKQYVYLCDLGYDYTEGMEVKVGRIVYKPCTRNFNAGKDCFKNITPEQLISSIFNIPNSYSKKGRLSSYEMEDWEPDYPHWLKLASQYKKRRLCVLR